MYLCFIYYNNSCGLLESSTTQCEDPGVPENGRRVGNNLEIGSTIYFQCFDGYELVGETSIECLPGSIWSARGPFCRIITGKELILSANMDLPILYIVRILDKYPDFYISTANIYLKYRLIQVHV